VQVAPREPAEHIYKLNDGKVVLKIHSSAKSSKSLPTLFEKENINGQLTVDAERGDSIHAIYITVGRLQLLQSQLFSLSRAIDHWSSSNWIF
jgi:hypothetical protein